MFNGDIWKGFDDNWTDYETYLDDSCMIQYVMEWSTGISQSILWCGEQAMTVKSYTHSERM